MANLFDQIDIENEETLLQTIESTCEQLSRSEPKTEQSLNIFQAIVGKIFCCLRGLTFDGGADSEITKRNG